MTMPEVVDFVTGYARLVAAPVRTGVAVTSVSAADAGYRVETDQGAWCCRAVVLASGAHGSANVPAFATSVPDAVHTLRSAQYRRPGQLDARGVLVVGASATGLQLADEIALGRPVTLCVGEHIRMLRTYRSWIRQRWLTRWASSTSATTPPTTSCARRVPSPHDRHVLSAQRRPERAHGARRRAGRRPPAPGWQGRSPARRGTTARWRTSSSTACSNLVTAGSISTPRAPMAAREHERPADRRRDSHRRM